MVDLSKVSVNLLLFFIFTIFIAAINDFIITLVITHLKLDVPTLLSPLLVDGTFGDTQQSQIAFIALAMDLVMGILGAQKLLDWFKIFSG
jgi:hypothetical protein